MFIGFAVLRYNKFVLSSYLKNYRFDFILIIFFSLCIASCYFKMLVLNL